MERESEKELTKDGFEHRPGSCDPQLCQVLQLPASPRAVLGAAVDLRGLAPGPSSAAVLGPAVGPSRRSGLGPRSTSSARSGASMRRAAPGTPARSFDPSSAAVLRGVPALSPKSTSSASSAAWGQRGRRSHRARSAVSKLPQRPPPRSTGPISASIPPQLRCRPGGLHSHA